MYRNPNKGTKYSEYIRSYYDDPVEKVITPKNRSNSADAQINSTTSFDTSNLNPQPPPDPFKYSSLIARSNQNKVSDSSTSSLHPAVLFDHNHRQRSGSDPVLYSNYYLNDNNDNVISDKIPNSAQKFGSNQNQADLNEIAMRHEVLHSIRAISRNTFSDNDSGISSSHLVHQDSKNLINFLNSDESSDSATQDYINKLIEENEIRAQNQNHVNLHNKGPKRLVIQEDVEEYATFGKHWSKSNPNLSRQIISEQSYQSNSSKSRKKVEQRVIRTPENTNTSSLIAQTHDNDNDDILPAVVEVGDKNKTNLGRNRLSRQMTDEEMITRIISRNGSLDLENPPATTGYKLALNESRLINKNNSNTNVKSPGGLGQKLKNGWVGLKNKIVGKRHEKVKLIEPFPPEFRTFEDCSKVTVVENQLLLAALEREKIQFLENRRNFKLQKEQEEVNKMRENWHDLKEKEMRNMTRIEEVVDEIVRKTKQDKIEKELEPNGPKVDEISEKNPDLDGNILQNLPINDKTEKNLEQNSAKVDETPEKNPDLDGKILILPINDKIEKNLEQNSPKVDETPEKNPDLDGKILVLPINDKNEKILEENSPKVDRKNPDLDNKIEEKVINDKIIEDLDIQHRSDEIEIIKEPELSEKLNQEKSKELFQELPNFEPDQDQDYELTEVIIVSDKFEDQKVIKTEPIIPTKDPTIVPILIAQVDSDKVKNDEKSDILDKKNVELDKLEEKGSGQIYPGELVDLIVQVKEQEIVYSVNLPQNDIPIPIPIPIQAELHKNDLEKVENKAINIQGVLIVSDKIDKKVDIPESTEKMAKKVEQEKAAQSIVNNQLFIAQNSPNFMNETSSNSKKPNSISTSTVISKDIGPKVEDLNRKIVKVNENMNDGGIGVFVIPNKREINKDKQVEKVESPLENQVFVEQNYEKMDQNDLDSSDLSESNSNGHFHNLLDENHLSIRSRGGENPYFDDFLSPIQTPASIIMNSRSRFRRRAPFSKNYSNGFFKSSYDRSTSYEKYDSEDYSQFDPTIYVIKDAIMLQPSNSGRLKMKQANQSRRITTLRNHFAQNKNKLFQKSKYFHGVNNNGKVNSPPKYANPKGQNLDPKFAKFFRNRWRSKEVGTAEAKEKLIDYYKDREIQENEIEFDKFFGNLNLSLLLGPRGLFAAKKSFKKQLGRSTLIFKPSTNNPIHNHSMMDKTFVAKTKNPYYTTTSTTTTNLGNANNTNTNKLTKRNVMILRKAQTFSDFGMASSNNSSISNNLITSFTSFSTNNLKTKVDVTHPKVKQIHEDIYGPKGARLGGSLGTGSYGGLFGGGGGGKGRRRGIGATGAAGSVPGILLRQNMDQWQAKRVWFFSNGDPHFHRYEYIFRPGRDVKDIENVCIALSKKMQLPRGVRHIFALDGYPIFSIGELEHGQCYVASETKNFKALNYTSNIESVPASVDELERSKSSLSKMSMKKRPPSAGEFEGGDRNLLRRERTMNGVVWGGPKLEGDINYNTTTNQQTQANGHSPAKREKSFEIVKENFSKRERMRERRLAGGGTRSRNGFNSDDEDFEAGDPAGGEILGPRGEKMRSGVAEKINQPIEQPSLVGEKGGPHGNVCRPVPRQVVRIINGINPTIQTQVLLNTRTTQEWEDLVKDLGMAVKLTKKSESWMETLNGRTLQSYSQLRSELEAGNQAFYIFAEKNELNNLDGPPAASSGNLGKNMPQGGGLLGGSGGDPPITVNNHNNNMNRQQQPNTRGRKPPRMSPSPNSDHQMQMMQMRKHHSPSPPHLKPKFQNHQQPGSNSNRGRNGYNRSTFDPNTDNTHHRMKREDSFGSLDRVNSRGGGGVKNDMNGLRRNDSYSSIEGLGLDQSRRFMKSPNQKSNFHNNNMMNGHGTGGPGGGRLSNNSRLSDLENSDFPPQNGYPNPNSNPRGGMNMNNRDRRMSPSPPMPNSMSMGMGSPGRKIGGPGVGRSRQGPGEPGELGLGPEFGSPSYENRRAASNKQSMVMDNNKNSFDLPNRRDPFGPSAFGRLDSPPPLSSDIDSVRKVVKKTNSSSMFPNFPKSVLKPTVSNSYSFVDETEETTDKGSIGLGQQQHNKKRPTSKSRRRHKSQRREREFSDNNSNVKGISFQPRSQSPLV